MQLDCVPLSPTTRFCSAACSSVLIDWLSCGFTAHSTQNRSFRRRFARPISCTTTQNKHWKLKPGFSRFLQHLAWKRSRSVLKEIARSVSARNTLVIDRRACSLLCYDQWTCSKLPVCARRVYIINRCMCGQQAWPSTNFVDSTIDLPPWQNFRCPEFGTKFQVEVLSSLLWCCWLSGRKGIRPEKKLSGGVLMWLSVWSEVQTCIGPSWCHCHSLSLASVKSRLVLPF